MRGLILEKSRKGMVLMNNYYPEGFLIDRKENKSYLSSISSMEMAMLKGQILEEKVLICDSDHNLILDINGIRGIIPREEGAIGIKEGTTRDIALISKVNKPVCFKILEIKNDEKGRAIVILSRKEAQKECYANYISNFTKGLVINAKVTHLEQFGCFVDIGCGIPSLIPIDMISVSRISHPKDRFWVGQDIKAVVLSKSNGKIFLTHKELLGTWEENASKFNIGETVSGIVRSVEDYGIFIELSPNLAGLAELRDNVKVGQRASCYIKALIPEKMKVKLIIVDVFDEKNELCDMEYYENGENIEKWTYSPPGATKQIETILAGKPPRADTL